MVGGSLCGLSWMVFFLISERLGYSSLEYWGNFFEGKNFLSWQIIIAAATQIIGIYIGYLIIDWIIHAKFNEEECSKHIRNGYISALAFLTIIFLFYVYTGKTNFFSLNHPFFIDLVVVLILTFGVFKKSRISAILLLIYFILSVIFLFDLKSLTPIFGIFTIIYALVFIYFFVQAIRGTLAYHKER